MQNYKLAVIIVTKNRADAIKKYALPSLARQKFQDFVCVVWDASDDNATQKIIETCDWGFTLEYCKAPRVGMTSQRNDAVKYILTHHSDVRFVLFIDDDCELFPSALSGVIKTFETTDTSLVNVPLRNVIGDGDSADYKSEPVRDASLRYWVKHKLGMTRHGATEFLYNYGAADEAPGVDVEWTSGCSMAYRLEIFRDEEYFFPEEFQRFGGYALGEDFAFSYFLHKKLGKRIINSLDGHGVHHAAPGKRLNIANMAAAKWHNFHLLFDALYDQDHGLRKIRLVIKFKLFMIAAAIKLLIRARSLDVLSVLRGIHEAKAALKNFYDHHQDFCGRALFCCKRDTERNRCDSSGETE